MSTLIQFTPTVTGPFQFQPTLAGTQYNAVVTWSLFGQRYYLNLYTLQGALVGSTAIVATGPTLSATFTWVDDGVSGLATAVTSSAHNVPVGAIAAGVVSETDTGFDGSWQMLSIGATSLTYAISNPGTTQPVTGQIDFQVNVIAPLGIDGTFLFRYDTQQFEYE